MHLSYWEKKTYFSNVDIVIIGSGIVGLNAAINLRLKYPKSKIVIVERGFLPYGASTRNAGFACFGSVSELLDDLTSMSEQEVFSLVEKRWKGLARLRQLLGDDAIGFEMKGGYEVFTDSDKSCFNDCVAKMGYLNKELKTIIGDEKVYTSNDDEIKKSGFKKVNHLIKNNFEGQIDTGKMMDALLNLALHHEIKILNGVDITHFEENENEIKLFTNHDFSFSTSKLLVCTNGFAKSILPELAVNPARAQVLITSPIKDLKVSGTFHYDKGYYYFRDIDNRLLFGGGRNLDFETEATDEFGLTQLVQNKLEELLSEIILPNTDYAVEQRWSGIMGLGNTKTTIVKQVSKNVYCAVRMGGMGIAIGSLIGQEAAEMVEL
ncbi:MAG: FAD-dependent oxidoreductase [Bacteroidia bacterium]